MIETLYAPQNKNIARQTKSDKIYLNVQKKVKEIVLKELKRKQLKNFNKRNKIRVFCVFSGDLFFGLDTNCLGDWVGWKDGGS